MIAAFAAEKIKEIIAETAGEWIPETDLDFEFLNKVIAAAPAGTTWPSIPCPSATTTTVAGRPAATTTTVAGRPAPTTTVATRPGLPTTTQARNPALSPTTTGQPSPFQPTTTVPRPAAPATPPRATTTTIPGPVTVQINGCTDDFSGALRIRLDATDPECSATETPLVWHVGRAVAVPGGREANRLQVCVDGNGIASVPPGRWRPGSTLSCPGARTWRLVGAAGGEISEPGIEAVCVSLTAVRVSLRCQPDERPLRFFVDGPAA